MTCLADNHFEQFEQADAMVAYWAEAEEGLRPCVATWSNRVIDQTVTFVVVPAQGHLEAHQAEVQVSPERKGRPH